ncbi:MAG: rhomboid family intramembrane serine protease [Myxococcales bacterium]
MRAMFPLRDDIDTRRTPWVTWAFIALNVAAFLWELTLGERLHDAFYDLGLVPAFYSDPQLSMDLTATEQVRPFLTSMFLHGGWTHVIGNLWMLWIFGDNVEDYLGHLRFVVFYLGAGVLAAVVHLVTNWGSTVPTIGASGAIAGVMGAYFVLYPKARVLAVVPLFVILWPLVVPAVVFIGLWFLLQFLNGASSLVAGMDGGVAWWAHIGGFVGGILLLGPLGLGRTRRQRAATGWPAGRLERRQRFR